MFDQSTEIIIEHLGYAPLDLVEALVDSVKNFLYKSIKAIHIYLLKRYKKSKSISKRDVYKGTRKLEALWLSLCDASFGIPFERQVMESVFVLPPSLIQEGWLRLEHQKGIDFTRAAHSKKTREQQGNAGATTPAQSKQTVPALIPSSTSSPSVSSAAVGPDISLVSSLDLDSQILFLEQQLYLETCSQTEYRHQLDRSAKDLQELRDVQNQLEFLDIRSIKEDVDFLISQACNVFSKLDSLDMTLPRSIHRSERDLFIDKFARAAIARANLSPHIKVGQEQLAGARALQKSLAN